MQRKHRDCPTASSNSRIRGIIRPSTAIVFRSDCRFDVDTIVETFCSNVNDMSLGVSLSLGYLLWNPRSKVTKFGCERKTCRDMCLVHRDDADPKAVRNTKCKTRECTSAISLAFAFAFTLLLPA